MHLDLSYNHIEIEEFAAMLKVLSGESHFGNLHFKLRLLNLMGNPMKAFDYKIEKMLDQFYTVKPQKLLIMA